MPRTSNKKHTILQAAADIVQRDGAGHLTIDAVAAEAGLSKGGVLYHFPNKRALLEGMLDTLIDSIDQRSTRHRDELNGQPGAVVRSLLDGEINQSPTEQAMSRAILAAAAEDPKLLDRARSFFAQVLQDMRDGPDPADNQLIVFLALQGLIFMDMLDLSPLSQTETRDVRHSMHTLLSESAI